jgi:type IV pilus assembly protein PilV
MSMSRQSNVRLGQSGFSMIEVLVTVVILSVGLLGVAGVQALGLRTANVALDHNTVTSLAVEITERMRANPTAFLDDDYVGEFDSDNPAAGNACAQVCTPADRAESDLLDWYTRLSDLNSASAEITRVGNVAQVEISWVDVGLGFGQQDGQEAQSFTYRARMANP